MGEKARKVDEKKRIEVEKKREEEKRNMDDIKKRREVAAKKTMQDETGDEQTRLSENLLDPSSSASVSDEDLLPAIEGQKAAKQLRGTEEKENRNKEEKRNVEDIKKGREVAAKKTI